MPSFKSMAQTTAFVAVYTVARVTDLFKPMGHLLDWTGDPYMLRFNIIPEKTWASRMLHALTGYRSVRLHHIMAPDHDRDLHNHPFTYKTLILRGGYVERFLDTFNLKPVEETRVTKPWHVYAGDSFLFHRIADVPDAGSWSLFVMRENCHQWGFLVDGTYVDRRTYFRARRWPGE